LDSTEIGEPATWRQGKWPLFLIPGFGEGDSFRQIVKQGWSVRPADRGSFEDILETLRPIRFKMTPAVDIRKASKFVALVDAAAAVKPANQFPPSMKRGKLRLFGRIKPEQTYDIPDGIIAHLTRECGGNVHDRHVVDITCGSFEKETYGASPHSGDLVTNS
jgi:hypothetical protein